MHAFELCNPECSHSAAKTNPSNQALDLLIPKTEGQMVVNHAHCLHESIAYNGSNELETSLLELFTHGTRFIRFSWHFGHRFDSMVKWLSAHELPDELVEGTEFSLNLNEPLGIVDCCNDFCPIADNVWIF